MVDKIRENHYLVKNEYIGIQFKFSKIKIVSITKNRTYFVCIYFLPRYCVKEIQSKITLNPSCNFPPINGGISFINQHVSALIFYAIRDVRN